MKKKLLLIFTLSMTLILSACGMSTEEIATYMTSLESSYQNGAYEQAQTEVKKLEKSTKNMTEEQKTKFDELKSSVEYAVASSAAINEGLNNAQSQIDQKMYYEASQELDKLTAAYTLPPAEKKKFDEKKAVVDSGIKGVKNDDIIQKAETALNSGDYNTASTELDTIDTSVLSDAQNQKYQSLKAQISEAKTRAEEERKRKEEEAKAKAGISESQAKSIALGLYSSGYTVISIREDVYQGRQVYSVGLEGPVEEDGFQDEAGVIIDKSTGAVITRVG